METVLVKTRNTGSEWGECIEIAHSFENWKEVSTFAYRLALQTDSEVRVESKGNGHYYHPDNAQNFLTKK